MENRQLTVPHNIIIEDRKNVSISGVTDVESFDEETVILMTYNIGYSDAQASGGGLLSRLFR